jgi:hypothetical protein
LAAPSSLQDLDERECAGRCVLGLTSCQALERGRRRVGGSAMVEVVVSGVLQSTDEGSCVKEEQERLLLDATNVRTEVNVVRLMENDSRVRAVGFLLTRFRVTGATAVGLAESALVGLGAWSSAWSSALS